MAKTERPKMGDLIKKLPEVVTPVQEVRPVATKAPEEELEKINGFWAPKALVKKVKIYAVENDLTQREVMIAALEAFFK